MPFTNFLVIALHIVLTCCIIPSGRTFDDLPYIPLDIDALKGGVNHDSFTNAFANASSEFVHCIVLHAHPLTMCQGCVWEYQQVNETFDAIFDDENIRSMLSKDRVQVIVSVHQQILNNWEKSYCDNCFDISVDGNGTQVFVIKNETLKIEELYNATYNCIRIHNKTDEKNHANMYNESCRNCSGMYERLNDRYEELAKKYKHSTMCMDIVDMMNSTRQLWSEVLKCKNIKMEVTLLFVIMSFFGLFPIFFYLGTWIRSDELKNEIIPQKRLDPCRSATELSIN